MLSSASFSSFSRCGSAFLTSLNRPYRATWSCGTSWCVEVDLAYLTTRKFQTSLCLVLVHYKEILSTGSLLHWQFEGVQGAVTGTYHSRERAEVRFLQASKDGDTKTLVSDERYVSHFCKLRLNNLLIAAASTRVPLVRSRMDNPPPLARTGIVVPQLAAPEPRLPTVEQDVFGSYVAFVFTHYNININDLFVSSLA